MARFLGNILKKGCFSVLPRRAARFLKNASDEYASGVLDLSGVLFRKKHDENNVFHLGREGWYAFWEPSLTKMFFSSAAEKPGVLFGKRL